MFLAGNILGAGALTVDPRRDADRPLAQRDGVLAVSGGQDGNDGVERPGDLGRCRVGGVERGQIVVNTQRVDGHEEVRAAVDVGTPVPCAEAHRQVFHAVDGGRPVPADRGEHLGVGRFVGR